MDRPAPSAEALALEAQRGSVPAFEQLVTRYSGPLYNFLWVRTGNRAEAEELAQEALLRAWQQLGRYDARWRFSTWLFTLARRLAVSAARSRGRSPFFVLSGEKLGELAGAPDPAALAQQQDEGRALWELAARVLRPEERSALWLRYGEEQDMGEIARVLGRPRVTVRVLLFRARERLAAALQAAGKGETCAGEPGGHAALARPAGMHEVGGLP